MTSEESLFSAAGAGPLWVLAIRRDSIVLTLAKTPDGLGFPSVKSDTLQGLVRWRTRNGRHSLQVIATEKPCRPGDPGVVLTHSVDVRLDARLMRGCGGTRADP